MKYPTEHRLADAALLEPFVIAAKTDAREAACELLFIHGSDLTWGPPKAGLFLVDWHADPHEMDEAFEVGQSHGELGLHALWQGAMALLEPVLIKVVREARAGSAAEQDVVRAAAAAAAGRLAAERGEDLGPVARAFGGAVPGLGSWLASKIGQGLRQLRDDQVDRVGLDAERYDDMVTALTSCRMVDALLRVSSDRGGDGLALTIGGAQGLRAFPSHEGSNTLELLRVSPPLAALKYPHESALPLFVAHYLNTHSFSPRPVAYPCARFGNRDQPEFDVVLPEMEVGFEVKLVHAPHAISRDQLRNLARDLGKQLRGYFAVGCATVFVLTNLAENDATELHRLLEPAPAGTNPRSLSCAAISTISSRSSTNSQRIATPNAGAPT